MSQRVGLIAGGGDLPLEIARSAPADLLVLACRGHCDPAIERIDAVAEAHWFALPEAASLLALLDRAGITQVVLAGRFDPGALVHPRHGLEADPATAALLSHVPGRNETALMSAVVRVLAERGIEVLPQAAWVPQLVPGVGLLGKHEPTPSQLDDVAFGAPLARAMGDLHAGQAIAVKDGALVAVEALEGTDAMIDRAVELAGPGLTVIKRARPGQDLRLDLPTVGPETLSRLAAASGSLLAVEAGRTLVLHRSRCAELADRAGLAWLAFEGSEDALTRSEDPVSRKGGTK